MLIRKLIHLSSALLGVAVLILPRGWALLLCGISLVISLGIDVARNRGMLRKLDFLFKENELGRPSGASILAGSFVVLAGLFPREVAGFAMIFFAVADPLASAAGRFFPLVRFGSKSLGGALIFLLVGFCLSIALPDPRLYIKIAASVLGAVVELLTQKVDDNLTVPMSVGLVMWLMMLL